MSKAVVYQRTDKKWGWRLRTDNGDIIATDGGQGYENEADAKTMRDRVVDGHYKDAKRVRSPQKE